VDADSNPTIALRKNGAAHTGTTTVTKRAATTGLYDCTFAPSGPNNTDQFQVEETATISSQAYVNIWNFGVFEELPQGMGSVSVDTNTGSIGADLIAINQEAITSTSGNSNYMADRFVNFLDHSSASGRTSGNFNTTTPDNAGITSNGSAIAALNDFDPSADTVQNVTTVQTCVSNTDMRGTDSANTVAPDNAGIAANGTAITALNDFNPATDTVATVGSVTNAVTTANASDVTAIKGVTDKLDTALVLDGAVYQYTVNALENAPSGGGGGGDATLAKQNTIISDIAALNDFNPSSDTVANVTTVGTCVVNSDMRGTDNANTVAPANGDITSIKAKTDSLTFTGNDVNANVQAGSSDATAANQVAIQNAIAALNDFDPSADTVAQVTDVALVAVCTTNTDMRGTDSANTIAPDNAGITANGVAIAALNDTTPQQFWDALTSGSYATGSFGESILVSQTGQRELLITSHHVASDVHVFQPNAIDAQAIDAGAVTKIQAGLATANDLATVTKTGVQYTATAQSGDTIQVTLS
jgi:hypothetical protein